MKKNNISINNPFIKLFSVVVLLFSILAVSFAPYAYAKENKVEVPGKVFSAEDFDYSFQTAESFEQAKTKNTIGTFSITGSFKKNGDMLGVDAYIVDGGSINFTYTVRTDVLSAADDNWHIVEDKSKNIGDIKLEDPIKSGAVIVQSGFEHGKWATDSIKTDYTNNSSSNAEQIYTTKDVQLQNGCYYRVIVAYKLEIKTGEKKIGFLNRDVKEEKEVVELYEFYATNKEHEGAESASVTPRKEIGKKINAGKDTGFSEQNEIDKKDPHYGWDLGTFVINGYTSDTVDNDVPVFLKNVGDKVTLWFCLKQDINNLIGDDSASLSIAEDKKAYDREFEITETNFKHGALIIRFTDYEGNVHDPVIYTDFLAANASTTADTKVQMFEEGDYEVALDYSIKNSPRQVAGLDIVPTYQDYRIFFRFKIRNGNCMVFPFDTETGAELVNNALTKTGFRLDLARSRYLDINVTHSMPVMGADNNLVEDVRFNRPAKDTDTYSDEGIYTIKVKNNYTNEEVVKKIFVGSDKYLLALHDYDISVDFLRNALQNGATVDDGGTIQGLSVKLEKIPESTTQVKSQPENVGSDAAEQPFIILNQQDVKYILVLIIVIFVLIIIHKIRKRRKRRKAAKNANQEVGR